jgi:hypothetical protein
MPMVIETIILIVMVWFVIGGLTAISYIYKETYSFLDCILWWPIIWVKNIIQSFIRVINFKENN